MTSQLEDGLAGKKNCWVGGGVGGEGGRGGRGWVGRKGLRQNIQLLNDTAIQPFFKKGINLDLNDIGGTADESK